MPTAHPLRQEWGRILKFLALGGCAAAINWLSRPLYDQVLDFLPAVICAYVTGMIVAFILFRLFVFPESPTPIRVQIQRFVLVNLVGIALTFFLSWLIVEQLLPQFGIHFRIGVGSLQMDQVMFGHGVAIAAPTVTSWFGHRYFTFRQGDHIR
jgi:putative flippase GtrA